MLRKDLNMYNGMWLKKPLFWTERFLLIHKTWMHFDFLPRLWIPIPFRVGVFLMRRQSRKATEKIKNLREAGLIWDPDKE